MNLKEFCITTINTLQHYKGKTKDQLMFEAVKDRLDKSFQEYDHELNLSLGYLKRRDELNVMRKINRKK